MGPRRSQLALLLTVLAAVFRAGSSACPSVPSKCPDNTGSPNPIGCEQVDFLSAKPFDCTNPRAPFIQKGGAGVWTEETIAASLTVSCDNSQWKVTDEDDNVIPSLSPIDSTDYVVCAIKYPAPQPCPPWTASGCSAIPGGVVGVDCEAVIASADHVTCTTSWKALFVISAAGSWELKSAVDCNTGTGSWESVTKADGAKPLDSTDAVICATKNPGTPDECPRLNTMCKWDGVGCQQPIEMGAPVTSGFDCPLVGANNKLYFKHSATTEKFQEALSITCKAGGTWEIEYKFGEIPNREPLKEELKAGDHLICATSNPEPDACSFYSSKPSGFPLQEYEYVQPNPIKVEAGKPGKCPVADEEAAREIFNGKTLDILSNDFPPVCKSNGKWAFLSDDKYEDWGDKAGCRVKKCKTCPMPIEIGVPMPQIHVKPPSSDETIRPERHGKCAEMSCGPANKHFALKEENDAKYRFHIGSIECETDGGGGLQWVNGVSRKVVEELNCIQMILGYDDNFYHVDLECPPDTEKPAVPGCDKAKLSGSNQQFLTCDDNKVMLIRKTTRPTGDNFWDQIKSKTIKFDVDNKLKWEVDLLGHTDMEYRDHENTIVCADSNPAVRPTTTTTTTTPAPLEPICELCQTVLNNTCPGCINGTNVNLETIEKNIKENITEKCRMTPFSKKFSLLTSGTSQILDVLTCERPVKDEDTDNIPDLVWKDQYNNPVAKFLARPEKEVQKWVGGQYGILAGALFIIGGMGFGCVFIYFRMRKQPSVREKKKKERGVTKKYTSANVVKTGGRSDTGGSREGGKSREPTKSTNESNLEDAPTLKL